MLPWQIWLIIAGICLIIEIATVGILNIMIKQQI
jgi:membrane protein implicated in regulation of membrane protease activity